MKHHLDSARARAQLGRHRCGNPNNPPPPPLTWDEYLAAFTAAVGVTAEQALGDAEAGVQRLAEIAPGWRMGA